MPDRVNVVHTILGPVEVKSIYRAWGNERASYYVNGVKVALMTQDQALYGASYEMHLGIVRAVEQMDALFRSRIAGALTHEKPKPPTEELIATAVSGKGDTYRKIKGADGKVKTRVVSAQSGNEYVLTVDADGVLKCSCPSQTAGGRDYCRHADFVRLSQRVMPV